jgi:hypothetical protein
MWRRVSVVNLRSESAGVNLPRRHSITWLA